MKDDKKETAGEKMFIRNFKKTGGVDMSIAFWSSLTCWFGGQVCWCPLPLKCRSNNKCREELPWYKINSSLIEKKYKNISKN